MPRFRMQLYDGPTSARSTEGLDVDLDDDAIDLARVMLLATSAYTHAEVYRGNALLGTLRRDSYVCAKGEAP